MRKLWVSFDNDNTQIREVCPPNWSNSHERLGWMKEPVEMYFRP